ncbi:OmpA family protein [Geomonas sp. Red32]|uniref:flagellar motor protein MotB n=1 Tax=Geomonas sp. Red32 TaxID=2912856 RepID=UPI00202CB2B0|nr:flagellar motor protein MotB [Geomonas sp. Red32]MCM0082460.1 OmpA family protein [Geomonas sp. Red32]
MARKKEPEKEANHERWLVSYGDLLTLLFAVFVTLYAMSQADVKKAEEAAASMRQAFGITSPKGAAVKTSVIGAGEAGVLQLPPAGGRKLANEDDLRGIKASLDAYLLKAGAGNRVRVSLTRRGLVVSLKEAGFFDSGSAVLKQDPSEVLATIASILKETSNDCRVEGHTDDLPIATPAFPSNWDLSSARATNVVKRLTGQYGVDPRSVSATGYGQYQPMADNATGEGRAQNRRVDIVILSPTTPR